MRLNLCVYRVTTTTAKHRIDCLNYFISNEKGIEDTN